LRGGMQMNCSASPIPSTEITNDTIVVLICYVLVFIISLVGNATMFLILFRNQKVKKRRVHVILFHNTIAHLFVTLFYIPKEIIHIITISWNGGNVLCKACKFMDTFGITLSAYILICICLDRFYSIYFPLKIMNATKLVTGILSVAWLAAGLSALPQVFMFEEAAHPCHPSYKQCISLNVNGKVSHQLVKWYSIVNIFEVYILPLCIIIVCYGAILWKIRGGIPEKRKCKSPKRNNKPILRSTGGEKMKAARSKTLKMTLIIVLAFLACWTPYTVATLLHFFSDSMNGSTLKTSTLFRKLLYAFAVFNSAISPYIYGYFSFDLKKEIRFLLQCDFKTVAGRTYLNAAKSDYETRISSIRGSNSKKPKLYDNFQAL
uniref:G_PROTEIN_RECEP_F1_2 domain-containing protein n=1 Tax=Rhabditophanes sp. KR3021 TaxID=114890 RepID=A0AC35TTC1_9BILA